MIIPIGVEDAKIYRTPWVSIGLATFTLFIFMVTWVAPKKHINEVNSTVNSIIRYWQDRPYLELPSFFVGRFIEKENLIEIKTAYNLSGVRSTGIRKKTAEQNNLNILTDNLYHNLNSLAWIKLSIIPAHGFFQPGWVSYMFLHAGFIHLFFNMLLFYVVAPLLEDIWGRTFFGLFYIGGGIIAGVCQYCVNSSSQIPILGASGAVAACIGAFAFRFYNRKIKFFYWFLIFLRGTFLLPAWFWSAFWIASEIISFNVFGGNKSVAFYTHISGFSFGFLFALTMKTTGIEKAFIAPKLTEGLSWKEHPDMEKANEALSRGDRLKARELYQSVLTKDINCIAALKQLVYMNFEENKIDRALSLSNRFFSQLLLSNDTDNILNTIHRFDNQIDISKLNPSIVLRLGRALEKAEVLPLAEKYFCHITQKGGIITEKAWLDAATLYLYKLNKPNLAKKYANKVIHFQDVHIENHKKALKIIKQCKKTSFISPITNNTKAESASSSPYIAGKNS